MNYLPVLYSSFMVTANFSKYVLNGGFPFPCQSPQISIFFLENLFSKEISKTR